MSKRAQPVDRLVGLFHEISGDVPDEASLARMRRVSTVLNLKDNDALWSVIATLEYYARLYEAMPERIRWASEGSLETARREVGGATEALIEQHRDALARCKATIQLAETMLHEHEARYQATLAALNEAALTALLARLSNQVARTAGNRMVGSMAVAARTQRERLDSTIRAFEQAVEAATARVEAMASRVEKDFARSMRRWLLVGGAVLGLMLLAAVVATGAVGWRVGSRLAEGTTSHTSGWQTATLARGCRLPRPATGASCDVYAAR
ncbi:hypothetical protein Q3A80_02430 [Burkholderia sp. SR8]|uniref:hypothetical protein n=1 Tax=Burkholderia sp. SR8 TaxID=3062277 RepID=UPI004063770E